jgi:hypothetical protein
MYIELSGINGVERCLPVVHFLVLFGSEPDELEDLAANGASLERAFAKHEHHELVLFVIVLVLETGAPHIAERRISSENNSWVVQGSEVDCLNVVQVIVDL